MKINKYQEALDKLRVFVKRFIINGDMYSNLSTLQELIDKEDKYKWHDIRKDQTDLPMTGDVVLVYFDINKPWKQDYVTYIEGDLKLWLKSNIIAWRYMEEFKDE